MREKRKKIFIAFAASCFLVLCGAGVGFLAGFIILTHWSAWILTDDPVFRNIILFRCAVVGEVAAACVAVYLLAKSS
jgi:hypothetical protein